MLNTPCNETIRVLQANSVASKSEIRIGDVEKAALSASWIERNDASGSWFNKAKCLVKRKRKKKGLNPSTKSSIKTSKNKDQ